MKLMVVEETEITTHDANSELRYFAALQGCGSRFISLKLNRTQGGRGIQATVMANGDEQHPVMYTEDIKVFESSQSVILDSSRIPTLTEVAKIYEQELIFYQDLQGNY